MYTREELNMNILIAADSFKGSCSARQVTDTIERAAKNVIPDVTITKIPVADGGEGTVDALGCCHERNKSQRSCP